MLKKYFKNWLLNFFTYHKSSQKPLGSFHQKIMPFDWFLSVLEQTWLENHEIFYIGPTEYLTLDIYIWYTSPTYREPLLRAMYTRAIQFDFTQSFADPRRKFIVKTLMPTLFIIISQIQKNLTTYVVQYILLNFYESWLTV